MTLASSRRSRFCSRGKMHVNDARRRANICRRGFDICRGRQASTRFRRLPFRRLPRRHLRLHRELRSLHCRLSCKRDVIAAGRFAFHGCFAQKINSNSVHCASNLNQEAIAEIARSRYRPDPAAARRQERHGAVSWRVLLRDAPSNGLRLGGTRRIRRSLCGALVSPFPRALMHF